MHSGHKIFQSIFAVFTEVMVVVSPGLSVMVVKGILTSQQKILPFCDFPPFSMSVCIHIKTHFKFIPVLHFQKEDLLSVSSCCSSAFKAPEDLFTSSASEYAETPAKPKESHLCQTGSNIAPIVCLGAKCTHFQNPKEVKYLL